MPRNSSGVEILPSAPFEPNTTISSSAVNANFQDIADEITASVPRDGSAPMTAALSIVDGNTAAPGINFNSDANTGYRRVTTDTGALVSGGADALTHSPNGVAIAKSLDLAAAVAVVSASTTDLGAAASNNVSMSGTATVTSFGTAAAGVWRKITAGGAFTLTHSADLILPGGVNIVAASGDTFEAQSLGGGDWRVSNYERLAVPLPPAVTVDNTVPRFNGTVGALQTSTLVINDDGSVTQTSTGAETVPNGTTAQRPGSPVAGMHRYNSSKGTTEYYGPTGWLPNAVIQTVYAENTSTATITTTIPRDDTIPQITEGTQILSASITPQVTTSAIRASIVVYGTTASNYNVAVALFRVGTANALATTSSFITGSDASVPLLLNFQHVPGSASSITYTVRAGPSPGAAGTFYLNGASPVTYGGTVRCTLILEEIAQ